MAFHYNSAPETSNLGILDDKHHDTLDQAVRNVLSTEPAERAYAQILDGLPTEQSLRDSLDYMKDHPVYIINHGEIFPGYIEKARKFRTGFDLSELHFESTYPRGVADVVGYWAESKIFGGAIVFDRGETEKERKAMWIHGDSIRYPRTLYPPTQEQFDSLTRFLTTPLEANPSCPLPIHGTRVNRPRWHPYHAFAYHHIFRDRYERTIPPYPPQPGCVESGIDWPKLDDKRILLLGGFSDSDIDDDQYAAAEERIRNITPASPLWRSFGNES
ncbi:hypothetical protein FGRMN_1189 [Fusarium graminum]|nr:hypothetical protein FGRMN_1189 [Fusarium graminum]